jgi:hypothetical protein
LEYIGGKGMNEWKEERKERKACTHVIIHGEGNEGINE